MYEDSPKGSWTAFEMSLLVVGIENIGKMLILCLLDINESRNICKSVTMAA